MPSVDLRTLPIQTFIVLVGLVVVSEESAFTLWYLNYGKYDEANNQRLPVVLEILPWLHALVLRRARLPPGPRRTAMILRGRHLADRLQYTTICVVSGLLLIAAPIITSSVLGAIHRSAR